MNNKDLTLEEKVDLLLKYQQKAIFWGRVKAAIYLILFIVFIVLPIVWLIMFVQSIMNSMDIGQFMDNVKSVGDLGGILDKINL